MRKLLYAAFLGALVVLALAALRAGEAPRIEILPETAGIGRSTAAEIVLAGSGRGLGRIEVELEQGGTVWPLAEREYPARPPWAFWGERPLEDRFAVETGADAVGSGLREGAATLRARAVPPPAWLRKGTPRTVELELPVLLTPPTLGVVSSLHYPAQGGSEMVVYAVGPSANRDGVEVAGAFFPGQDVPGGPAGRRFALFAVPFDFENAAEIRLVAEDAVGNRAERAFVDRLLERPYETDRIEVSERFMESVVPEILANTPGWPRGDNLVASYVSINRGLRADNAAELDRLAASSRPEFLWRGAFVSLPNAQVMSSFADRRSYFHGDELIDQQDHLGFDLASVKHAPVPAANSGVVVLARYFGIYGNAVVLDHGYGLMSLYGHLSSIDVSVGDAVERGQTLGRTGETGLAAGDHLHFTMLLGGRAVSPVEWWDAKWIRDRLAGKLVQVPLEATE